MADDASSRRFRGGAWLAVAGSLALGACFLPSLDLTGRACPCVSGYVCDQATQKCVISSGGEGGATTASANATATGAQTTGAAQGGGGSGGQVAAPAPPLVVSGSVPAATIALTVAGAFRLEFTDATHWHVQRWFDLPTSDVFNLAAQTSRDILHESVEMQVGGNFYGVEQATLVGATFTDEAPARAIVENTVTFPPGGPFSVHNTYTVYASGRVGVRVLITNATGSSQAFDTTEVNHTSVNEAVPWTNVIFAGGNAAMFQRSDGATPRPTVLSISHGTFGAPGQDFLTNYYWDTGGLTTLPAGGTFERTGELQVGLGDQTLAQVSDRADDVMQPGLAIVSGGTMIGSGYDSGAAAYTIAATGTPLTFAVTASRARHAPAFVIDGWTAPSWSLSKNGAVMASSAMPDGPGALAYQDLAASRLVLVSVDSIPVSALDAERTFVLQAN